ncbi:cupin domain-containing protein [Halostagnicola kamekurae]|uniref:Cupin domain-containing protein n=1 Tax=Halostagnicola kamekurae TaxID=619731 RepID=A0A1I6TIF6_9EURY|nr:cupin domain-containing protein [Halostagnicola kamekurae]SFS88955.1 Cupin domain-containing protein [Halostagnicola kamekurae]
MTDSTTRSPSSTERVSLETLEGEPHARVFEGEPKTVRLTLAEGQQVPAHAHPGRQVVFHVLEGRMTVTVGEDRHELRAGELLRFDGEREVSPKALERSVAIVVLAQNATE